MTDLAAGTVATIAVIVSLSTTARAQSSTFTGRVLTDSGVAIPGAEVALSTIRSTQRTNAKGEFTFSSLVAGDYVVGVRIFGYAPKTERIEVADAGNVIRNIRLTRLAAELPEVPVTATLLDRKLSEFYDRRKFGIGRFLDSAEFAKAHGIRTSDKLTRLPGLIVLRGGAGAASVASTRSRLPGGGWCAAAVWIDNLNVGPGYNVNLLEPTSIAAIEWYAGEATTPMRFSVSARRGQRTCGVLVIWLR